MNTAIIYLSGTGVRGSNTFLVSGESIIEACEKNYEIIFRNSDPDPTVLDIPHVKETLAIEYVANFSILVQMLNEEYFDFVFVGQSYASR